MVAKITKRNLEFKRSELVAATSLELLKQKKITDSCRVLGRNFAKQSESNLIREVLQNSNSYVVAVKCVNVGRAGSDLLPMISNDNLGLCRVFSVAQIRDLYPILTVDSNLKWLTPVIASSSVYLLIVQNHDCYLKLIRDCIKFESNAGDNFFEILFLKERAKLIDLRQAVNKQFAKDVRELYATRTVNDILFELSSCILNVPATFNTIFSVSLVGLPSAFYPISHETVN